MPKEAWASPTFASVACSEAQGAPAPTAPSPDPTTSAFDQALATNRAYDTLDIRSLLRYPRRSEHFTNAQFFRFGPAAFGAGPFTSGED